MLSGSDPGCYSVCSGLWFVIAQLTVDSLLGFFFILLDCTKTFDSRALQVDYLLVNSQECKPLN